MHLTGMPAERASISDGLDEMEPKFERPEATDATPSMFGPPATTSSSRPSSAK